MPLDHPIRRILGKVLVGLLVPFRGKPMIDIDGNSYETIVYGRYTWMAENLRVTRFRDGTDIAKVTGDGDWDSCDRPAYCFLNNTDDPHEQARYGALYNWRAALYSDNPCQHGAMIAPEGWRLPSYYDWARLEMFLINRHYYSYFAGEPYTDAIAKAMASTTGWADSVVEATPGYDPDANNRSLFNALPAARRFFNGQFESLGYHTSWWRSGGFDSAYPGVGSCVRINHDYAQVMHRMDSIGLGLSVRLVRALD